MMKNYILLFLFGLTAQTTLWGELTQEQAKIASAFDQELCKVGQASLQVLNKCFPTYPKVITCTRSDTNTNFLQLAIEKQQSLEIIKLLVEKAKDVDFDIFVIQDYLGHNAFHYAIISKNEEVLKYLLQENPNPDYVLQKNNAQETPYGLAQTSHEWPRGLQMIDEYLKKSKEKTFSTSSSSFSNSKFTLEDQDGKLKIEKIQSKKLSMPWLLSTAIVSGLSFGWDKIKYNKKMALKKEGNETKKTLSYFAHLKKHPKKHAGFFVGLVAGLATIAQLIPTQSK